MGIYDRDYVRDEQPGFFLGGEMSMTVKLLLVTLGIYLIQVILDPNSPRMSDKPFTNFLALHPGLFSLDLLTHPWWIVQPLTYGFAHARGDIWHVLFNMFGLWFFGRDVEGIYGRRVFLWFYLTGIIISGLGWLVLALAAGGQAGALIGASGGVMAILILYVFHFPRRELLIWGVLPMQAWVLGLLYVVLNVMGAVSRDQTSNVAFTAHLAGAAYGFVFFRTRWSLGNFVPKKLSLKGLKRRPKLRVHDPEENADDAMNTEVDEILRKIQRSGQESLTAKEKRTLERASRKYQEKRK